MKRLFILFLFFTLPAVANESAKVELQNQLAELTSFSATFEQNVYDEGELMDTSSGTLMLKKPNKMRWETKLPEENLIVADGINIWNVDSFVEQVTIFSQQDTVKDNPIMLLTSSEPAEWEKFTVSKLVLGDAEKQNEKRIFDISAKDSSAQIVKLTVTFVNDNLVSLQTLDSQQQVSNMTFKDIKMNGNLEDFHFEFVHPAHFTVDDQR